MEFINKVVLITGASSGIGFRLAEELSKENCRLILLARRKNILDKLADLSNTSSGKITTIECDVSKKEDVEKAFEKISKIYNHIDIAILNSGVSYRSSVDEFDSQKAEETFGVNVMGMIYFIEKLLPNFMEQKKGMIVGISSLSDVRGFPKSGFYCASKAAASALLESLRVELQPHNVKVLTVKPGFVKTPMTAKNEFKMPFLMNDVKAAKIILNGIKKEKKIIEFPLPTAWGSKFVKFLPNFIFDFAALKQKEMYDKK
jgi:short-subunit dehydrogenase